MLSIFGDSSSGMLRAYDDGDGDVNIIPAGANQWINIWIKVNHFTKTFRVATSTGSNNGTDSGRDYDFGRRTAATVGTNPLVTFGFHEVRNVPAELDDLYYADGTNLTNPLYVPAVPTGETLSVENNLALASGTTLEFDLLSESVHDKLVVGGHLTAAGTLRVVLDGGAPALAAGDTFDQFDSGSTVGTFASFDLPALTPGLAWSTNSLSNGILTVVQSVATNPTNLTYAVSNGLLTLSWPHDHIGWRLQTQTNPLTVGLRTNWQDVPDSTQTNRVFVPMGSEPGGVFFRMILP